MDKAESGNKLYSNKSCIMRFLMNNPGKVDGKNQSSFLWIAMGKDEGNPPEDQTCLNCEKMVSGHFCSHCGQKSGTTRFGLQQIISTDVMHGLYSLNPGIINTLRSLAIRPGHAVREYVQGKRVNFLNYLSLFFLAITVVHFVHDHSHVQIDKLFVTRVNKSVLNFHNSIVRNYGKVFAFLMTPLVAVCSYFTFKRANQNFAEHCVLNFFKASASLLLISLFYTMALVITDHIVLKIAYVVFFILQVAYEFIFYCQYFESFGYSKKGLMIRSLFVTMFATALLVDKWTIIM